MSWNGTRQCPRPGQPAGPQIVDKNWVTARFEIDPLAIGNEFVTAKIPAQLKTMFLRVEVEREEQLPDGSWGNKTILKPLANSPLAANPMPPAGNLQAEQAYQAFAQANCSLYPSIEQIASYNGQADAPNQTGEK